MGLALGVTQAYSGFTIPHLGLRTTVRQFPCPSITIPKPPPTQPTRTFFLMDSSDPVLLLLKKFPCSSFPTR